MVELWIKTKWLNLYNGTRELKYKKMCLRIEFWRLNVNGVKRPISLNIDLIFDLQQHKIFLSIAILCSSYSIVFWLSLYVFIFPADIDGEQMVWSEHCHCCRGCCRGCKEKD